MRPLLILAALLFPARAVAHVSEQGFVLLLPTGGYILGGAATVALTVLALAFAPTARVETIFRTVRFGMRVPLWLSYVTQLSALIIFLLCIGFGFIGASDPLRNPLTLLTWTVFWIALVCVQGALFDIWRWINPFAGAARLGADAGWRAPFRLPTRSQWPALALFAAFAAFLLADPAPADPRRLALFALSYVALTLLGCAVFGPRWLVRVEVFTVLMRTYRQTALLSGGRLGFFGWRCVCGAMPGAVLALFILALLGSGSFDGLNETFWWLQKIGVNPLEFPGRSAVITPTVLGLLLANALLIVVYAVSIWLGVRLAGGAFWLSLRLFAPSVLPIAIAYHTAHYLTSFLVDWQYVKSLISILLGGPEIPVTTGFFNTLATVRIIWLSQAGAVVLGHVVAILVAHALALRLYGNRRQATLSQLPLAIFMIFYTLFGLWLLASPRGA
ncbi:MAG: hypothetical protein HKN27_04720 [Silicimonas sp.]|nr:hypothetical protein [Silicimonas sp.]